MVWYGIVTNETVQYPNGTVNGNSLHYNLRSLQFIYLSYKLRR